MKEEHNKKKTKKKKQRREFELCFYSEPNDFHKYVTICQWKIFFALGSTRTR